jgi:hypothetical protein
MRVRATAAESGRYLPAEEAWPIGERRSTGERKYRMLAPAYAARRSALAKPIGLGRKPTPAARRAGGRKRKAA